MGGGFMSGIKAGLATLTVWERGSGASLPAKRLTGNGKMTKGWGDIRMGPDGNMTARIAERK